MNISKSAKGTPAIIVIIDTSIESVWEALRDKEKIAQWFGWDYQGLEAEINDIYFTNVREEGESDKIQRSLVVNGGDTFILTAQGDKTELQLVRRPLDGTAEDDYYDTITEGWISFIEQLRFLLECEPRGARKTIVTHKQLQRGAVFEQLGLSGAQEGQAFEGVIEGLELSGSVRFSTAQQIGLQIDDWGPGLMIIQFGENMQLLTTYALESETFRNLEETWSTSA